MRLRARVLHATGATKHCLAHVENGELVKDDESPIPTWVEIQSADGAFYLLYLNARGQCLTDTWHESLQQAQAQALREFGITERDWMEIVP